ncbi:hypothetical protein ACLB2K_014904 [Fragaria x ananassa]
MADTFPAAGSTPQNSSSSLIIYRTRKPIWQYPGPTMGSENCTTYGASNRQSYRIGVGIGGRGTGTFIWLEFGRRRRKRSRDIGKGQVRLGTSSTAKGLFWAPILASNLQ